MYLQSIGTVHSPIHDRALRDAKDIVSTITVHEQFVEALDGIESYSHIVVLYWFHLSERPASMKVHPRGDPSRPKRGIFATRSPVRPNPIGLTVVRLLERRGNELLVRGLDAIDGTPVVDIKPHIQPGYDV